MIHWDCPQGQQNATVADSYRRRLDKRQIHGGNHMAEIDGLTVQMGDDDSGYSGPVEGAAAL